MKLRSHNPEYCFLAGTGRSGTTVLRNSLGQHPEIHYNGKENNVVQDVVDVARHNFVSPSRQYALVVDKETYCAAFRDLLIKILWPEPKMRSRPVWMAAINPTAETMEFLLEIFPDAKVIGLVRDGVDVVLSRQNHRSFKTGTFESHCRTWVRTQPVVEWGKSNSSNFRLFRYESLADRVTLSKAFSELFGWMGLSQNDAPVEHVFETTYHPTELEGSLSGSNVPSSVETKRARWQLWSNAERELFRSICGPFMKQMGFEMPF